MRYIRARRRLDDRLVPGRFDRGTERPISWRSKPRMSAFPITIYHNPACGTSRNALAMIRAAGYEPMVVAYLETGWTRPQLQELLAAMGARPRDILREKGTPAAELGLLDPGATDDRILNAMVAHPILVNRPIVVTPKGVKLARPSETVLDILERPRSSSISIG
jgi:arsenate reductase